MANDVCCVTIAFDLSNDIQSTFENYKYIFNDIKPSTKIIHGITTREFSLLKSICKLNIIQQIFSPKNIWINLNDNYDEDFSNSYCISSISFGSLSDTSTYNYHKIINDIQIEANENRKEIFIMKDQYHLRMAADCLDTYFIIDQSKKFIFPLRKSVQCFEKTNAQFPHRTFMYTEQVDSTDLADTNTICLTFSYNSDNMTKFIRFLTDELNLQCFYSVLPMNMIHIHSTINYKLNTDNDFLSNYVWKMVLSLGFYIKDRLTLKLMRQIKRLADKSKYESYPKHQFYKKMIAIYYAAKMNQFFHIEKEFLLIKPQWIPPIQTSYDYVPRIILTPYGQYPRPLKPLRANRILRQNTQFGSSIEHFCRVILRDCDMTSIQYNLLNSWRKQLKNILIKDGLIIGEYEFKFLLFSNSQLRDKSLYFYRQYKQNTVNDIYQWMGTFNHEKSIGTRIARMAQCFTSTIHGITLQPNQLICIDDKYDEKKRCFTDGCGKISSSLLRKQFHFVNQQEFTQKRLPSVIQIRCSGLKGVLVEAPDLQEDIIHYRRSQQKFQSNHLVLELINYSKPKPISFNRQVITLLEYMGIKTSIFVEFQNEYRKRLSMALICKKSAVSLLRKTIHSYNWEYINQSGILIPQEPFIRSLLMTICRDRIQRLRDKTHIPLSMDDGRMLYGVVDDTDSLNYGEIFIQISHEMSNGEEKLEIINDQTVIVTRMPCHHPGDIRMLHAVDKPHLHHLVDCIVFPGKGLRPHSTEMSGGDLDGDEYWNCWNSELINQINQVYDPAEYLSPEKPKFEGEHTLDMMIDFILDILSNGDQVGILSRRHLALCARYSPNNVKALTIAQFINDALDFPKTGINSITPEILKYLNVYEYPNFMQNKIKKNFECNKALANLFKDMDNLYTCHSIFSEYIRTFIIDEDLLIDGYEQYLDQAKIEYIDYCDKINMIMNIYDLNDETELITGCHFSIPEELQNNDDLETANQQFRALRLETKQIFEININQNSILDYERKASACYYVTYSSFQANIKNKRQYLSFPWTMYELLCQIKRKKTVQLLVPISYPHQSLEKIGKALIQANWKISPKDKDFVCQFVIQWIQQKSIPHKFKFNWQKEIINFCISDKNFKTINDTARSNYSRIGEQFLLLIDFLSIGNTNKKNLQPVANICLLLLHEIALTDKVN